MRKFGGLKPLAQILELCKRDGVAVDMTKYDAGGDVITFSGGGCEVAMNSVNGKFSGVTPWNEVFGSNLGTHENETWFQSLLMFFYEPLPAVPVSPFVGGDFTAIEERAGALMADAYTKEGQAIDFKFDGASPTGRNVQMDLYVAGTVVMNNDGTGIVTFDKPVSVLSVSAPEVVKPAEPVPDTPASYPDPFK